MLKKLLAVLIIPLMIFPLLGADNDDEKPPECAAYVLIEPQTHTVLDSYCGDKHLNCGYLSKLMALLLIAEDIETGKYGLQDMLTASDSVTGTKGSVVWLQAGDTMTVEELLKSLIIGNANDALTVLAEASERTVDEFVKRMNGKAFDLGLKDTVFYTPYGYYDEREYTTANDLAVISSELSKYEFMRQYFCTWRDFVKAGKTELVNENTLARTYKSHIGFKAAHSEQSGYCIAEGACSEDGTTYIAVVLGGKDEDVSFGTAKTLLRKGFREFKVTATLFPEEMMKPISVRNGEAAMVEIGILQQSPLVISRWSSGVSAVTVIPEYVEAPVMPGQVIGTVSFYDGKTLLYESDIIAKTSVRRLKFTFIIRKMMYKITE